MIDLIPLPPAEAISYFEQKGYAIGFNHHDVWQQEHQAAFTVAKVMQQDILADIRSEITRALKEGTTYEDFAKRLTPVLQDKGWWGRKPMVDPLTGEEREVQLGSPRRLKLIYDTNLRTAHSEGQWERIQRNKASTPYLTYDANNSAHPREQHAKWDGLTLPVDDPFWLAHFPVKDYKCKCRAIPRTASQAERLGIKPDTSPTVPTRDYVNPRTGEIQHVPQGVDPSFYYPPGGRRASMNQHLIEKLESAPPPLSRSSVVDLVNGPAFADWYKAPSGNFAMAYLERETAASMGAKTQLVVMSDETLAKQLRHHPEIQFQEYRWVQAAIDDGVVVPGNQVNSTVYLLEQPGYVVVVKVTRDGQEIYMTSLRRLSRDEAKRDEEVQRLRKKAGK